MATTHTPYELVLHDRPLDTLFNQLPFVFVPSHVTTLGQLSDIAQAYGNLGDVDSSKDENSKDIQKDNNRPSLVSYHENVGSRSYQQKQLQWRFFYLDMEKLDQELEKMMQQQNSNGNHRSFLRVLESELLKVYDFYHLKLGEIQRRITYCNSQDPSFMKKAPHKRLLHLESEMKALPWEIQHLVHFVKTNYRALFMMVYKYDRHLSFSSSSVPRQQQDKQRTVLQNQLFRLVASKSFCEPTDLFALIISLNHLYKLMRTNQLRSRDSIDSWSPTHVDEADEELRQVPNYTSIYVTNSAVNNATTRTTPPRLTTTLLPSTALPPSPATTSDGEEDTSSGDGSDTENDDTDSLNSDNANAPHDMLSVHQFWVHPDNLTEVLLYITKYMDLNSDSTSFPPAQVDTASRRSVQQSNQSSITTLHLDTPDLETYNNRIVLQDKDEQENHKETDKGNHYQRREFKSLRMRWYEEDQSNPVVSKPVVAMEEKVYLPSRYAHVSTRRRNLEKSPCRSPDENNTASPFDKHHHQKQLKQQQHHHHHHRHGNKEYTRHRLWLKSKNMEPWISGDWSLKHLLNKPYCHHHRPSIVEHCNNECDDSLLREQIIELEKDARLKQIQPVLKTMLRRTVFSDHETQLIISIDTEIAIVRHTHSQAAANRNEDDYRCYNSSSSEGDDYFDHRPPPPKSRISSNEPYPYPSVSSDDMVRFPYAVIKISCPALSHQHYPWLSDLLVSPLLEPVNGFSTYAHGVGVLMPEKVQQLPQWLSKMDLDISRKGKRGQLLKQQLRSLNLERRASSFDESNMLKLPPTHWSTTSAIYSPTSTNSSSSCVSSHNIPPGSTRATTPSSSKGKAVSEEDIPSSAAATTTTETISDECQPLLQNQKRHQRPSVGSYCSFDHPSSSRSNPAQCRDCMSRRQSASIHHTSKSNSRTSSSGSLFSQYNNNAASTGIEGKDNNEQGFAASQWITQLIRVLWPTLGDFSGYKKFGHGSHDTILPTHNNDEMLTKEESNNSSKTLMINGENRPSALKMTLMCIGSAAAVAFLFYYILSIL